MEYLREIFTFNNLLMMNIGVAAGIIIGMLPGLSVLMAVTVLLPFTFGMDSLAAIYLLLGAYCAGNFGGSISAILINSPGTPSASATAIDGYPMMKKGLAGDALKCALTGSTFGGLFSTAVLFFAAPALASVALEFGPAEYFSLCIFGLCVVVSICCDSITKGATMAALGLLFSTVGIDPIDGLSRFRFGYAELLGGFPVAAVMLGSFAVSEILMKTKEKITQIGSIEKVTKSTMSNKTIISRYWKTLLRSSIIGTVIGVIPGTGCTLASFLGYNFAKSSSKHPETFGNGDPEGVIACETGDNGVTGGALVPMLTLGIPGDTTMAVLMGALTMQGIAPGPQLFTENRFWVFCLMGGLFIINLFMYLQGLGSIRIFALIAKVPSTILIPCIMAFCLLGGYSIRNNMFDVLTVMVFGLLAYIFRYFDYPVAPMAIGLVLGNLAETNFRRAMVMSKDNLAVFVTKPISCVFLIISALFLLKPFLSQLFKVVRRKTE